MFFLFHLVTPQDGILESYWGEHIHLGYYNDEERKKVFVAPRTVSYPRIFRIFGVRVIGVAFSSRGELPR